MTTREYFRSPRKVADIVRRGATITVTRGGKPFFITSPETATEGFTGKDFADWAGCIKSKETDLSQRVDEIVYGI